MAVVPALGARGQVALDLAVDRAAVAAEDLGDLGHAALGLAELGDQVSFVTGELAVLHGWGSFLAGSESLPVCQLTFAFRGAGFVALSLAISDG